MSRSIHDTRRFLFEALHDDFADPELQGELIRTARGNLRKQRAIKDHSRQQRRRRDLQIPPLDLDRVPILIRDDGPFAHHLPTEEDLRSVMHRLPPGSLDGLNTIELCLGGEARGGTSRSAARDPYTGRLGREVLPGVFASLSPGSYDRESRTIRLFAHVYQSDAPGELAIALKLLALVAFVQEAARHFDHVFRAGGPRWRADDREKNDGYATRMGFSHAARCVLPYLQERYPAKCAALSEWMKEHGGVALPLIALIEPRRGRSARTLRALRALVAAVRAGRDQSETRVDFARALHHAGYHDFALAAVARILAGHPAHPGALSVRACVASCRGEHGLAEFICHGVLASAPGCVEAWEVLSRVYLEQRRWENLVACATRGFDLSQTGDEARYRQLSHRAQALLALGRWEPLSADLGSLREWGTEQGERAAAVFATLMLCRRGQWAEAHAEASRLLALPGFAGAGAELAAVRFESAYHLRLPQRVGKLTARQVERLRAAGYESWVDRLIAECGLSVLRNPARTGQTERG